MSQAKGPTSLPLINTTIPKALADVCKANGSKDAFYFVQENVTFTFTKFATEVDKLAAGLRASGLKEGDHVMLWGANYSNMLVSMFACCRAGFIFSCMNPTLTEKAVLKSLAMGDFRAVIVFPTVHIGESYRVLTEIVPELRTSAKGHLSSKTLIKMTHVIMAEEDHKHAGTYTLSEIFGKGTTQEIGKLGPMPDDPNALATIQFSMGTTGEPKPVMLSHFQVLNSCKVTGTRLRLHEKNQILCCPLPLFRGPVMTLAAMSTVVFGNQVVYPAPLPLPKAIFASIEEKRCTCLMTNPIALHLMLRSPLAKNTDLSSLTTALFVGEHVPVDLLPSMKKLTSINQTTVGVFLTEAGCMPIMSVPSAEPESLCRTQGQVVDHFEVKILGFKGELAPRGEIGDVCVRPIANSEFLGYYRENEMSRSFFVHGWVLTGDVGVMDQSGNVQVLGQKQDVIFSAKGAANKTPPIFPWDIERHLATHPSLLGVQLVGVPGTAKTCAIVVLKTNAGNSDEVHDMVADELKQMCMEEKVFCFLRGAKEALVYAVSGLVRAWVGPS